TPFIHCVVISWVRTITVAGAPSCRGGIESRLCASIVLTLRNRRWACPAGPFPRSRRKGRRRRSTARHWRRDRPCIRDREIPRRSLRALVLPVGVEAYVLVRRR